MYQSIILAVACPRLIPPRNGSIINCPRFPVYGEVCHVTCHMGFKLHHENPLVCERDDSTGRTYWTRNVPKCLRKCPYRYGMACFGLPMHLVLGKI